MATTTSDAPSRTLRRGKGAAEGEQVPARAAGEQLAPPPKLRRRPALIAASVAAICLGALASLWAYTSSSSAQEVLAVRQTVQRGDVIQPDDLMTVRIGVDPALKPLSADQASTVVGKRAALDMPAGGVVTAEQVTDANTPPKGESVVGISLTAALLPANELRVGDPVRVVTTPGQAGDVTVAAPDAVDAVVVGMSSDETTGNTIVNVQVPYADAAKVAALAATGKVALVLDSRER